MAAMFDVGDTVRAWGVFKAATFTVTAGVPAPAYALADPTTVTLLVQEPDGTQTPYTYGGGGVSKHSTGVFYRDLPLTAAGTWRLRWAGTGAAAAAEETLFLVREQATA